MNKPITVIIPNFNGAHLLLKNLPSVIKTAASASSTVNIIVVDDGSSDNSLEILAQNFPNIKVIVHEINRGFSEAIFTGVNAANTELLYLLNSDVQLDEESNLNLLADYFDEDDVFSVSPLILNDHGHITKHSWNRKLFKRGGLKFVEWSLDQAINARKSKKLPALYASGGSMMVRRSMFMALHGFHPLYKPFYSEDFDIGLRAWRRGWRSYFEPNAQVIHQSKGSIKENVRRAYVKQVRRRNNYILEWTHLPLTRLLATVLPLTMWQLLGEVLLLDRVNIKGFLTALPKLREVVLARREIKRQQKFSFLQVLKEVR